MDDVPRMHVEHIREVLNEELIFGVFAFHFGDVALAVALEVLFFELSEPSHVSEDQLLYLLERVAEDHFVYQILFLQVLYDVLAELLLDVVVQDHLDLAVSLQLSEEHLRQRLLREGHEYAFLVLTNQQRAPYDFRLRDDLLRAFDED